jgi:hypothetical protein
MINPDFHMTLYVSEEVIRWVSLTIGFVATTWGIVKMTDILFGRRKEKTE